MKTKIEWCDESINPVKGLCPQACPYCYARRMYKRFHWDESIRFDEDALWKGIFASKPNSKIFIGSTMELFGKWVNPTWVARIYEVIRKFPDRTFIFLTKRPGMLAGSVFPDNVWIGVSTTGFDSRSGLEDIFKPIQAKVKFVSIEPLLDYSPMDFRWVDWVIIGQQTPIRKATVPKMEWLMNLVEQAVKEKCKVFLKDNLIPLIADNEYSCSKEESRILDLLFTEDNNGMPQLRQEFPK